MNLRVFQERNSRSRSPKRYSLNRKIKERKHVDSCEFGTQLLAPVSSQTRVTESRGRANEFPGYQAKRNNEVRNTALSSLQDGQGQKQSWSTSTPIQHFTMPARSPGDFSRIASQFENNMRRKVENQRYVQVPYTHYPLNYGPHFGNFQGIQSIQSQNPLQNGVGLQGNPRPFMQSYITPMQPGTAVHFSHQMTAQRSEAYNAFTAYNNPFGMFWPPNYCFPGSCATTEKNIEGQIVLITGAGGGIGRKLYLEFAGHGAKLVLWDINKDTNEETAAQVRALGKVAHTYVCDLSSKDDIYRVSAKVQREVGPVDILVNNAGILSGRKLLNLKDEDIERTMKINTLAHFWTIRSFLPRMLERNKGHIVNITSLAGSFPTANLTDYCASKFGATGLNHSLALELHQMGRDDIKLTCVQPYTVNTGLVWHPQSRFPSLHPTLEVDYVAKEIVAGTLRDEPLVIIPRAVVLNYALAGLMPIKAGYVLSDFLRVGVGEHIPGEEKKAD